MYLLASIGGSIITASAFHWPHQYRYIVPAAAPIAVLTAQMFAQMWQSRRFAWQAALVLIVLTGLLQLIYDAWSPYPLCLPNWTKAIMQAVGEDFKMHLNSLEVPGVSVHPLPDCDWGTSWVLSTIETYKGGQSTTLMIMPGCDEINCSSYYYLTKISKDGIEVASPRQHTELGDQVRFDPKLAAWYEWYVLKTGNQGRKMYNLDSKVAYDQWCDFARNAKLYKRVKTKLLPDGSTMELYRKILGVESLN
jgi:hypothetical protein